MAKIIGHSKLWYKHVCDKCHAIILFDKDELTNHNHIDKWNEPVYDHSTCKCPECGNELSFNKRYAAFAENTDEPIRDVKFHEKALNEMKALLADDIDYETGHREADDILVEFLKNIGCNELADAFDAVGKWYS